ncbi:hypothetical protein SEA_BLINO_58 [Gordonia phage Blino]|uniref:Uncharacterized protein n=1 Tax=Gordonia phage Blino TaxID=2793696 RepID=A0A7T0M106_9CAUD|nr:hypothetical protein BIZ75_gp57 [Gordonia phage CarolAnn]YP_010114147.1 hypothetical protein KNV70_gp58 [Gordonia phage Blino]AOE44074.1 hypothetical protein SEA_CAROLANN_57 [Gordonia phage CarolAnn]QPL14006.1 hypothetical protein SEA_BLINO_58 [Gordonia phage Blino]
MTKTDHVEIVTQASVDIAAGETRPAIPLCSDRRAAVVDRPVVDGLLGHDVVVTVDTELGAVGGLIFTLPFTDVAELVDQVRDGCLDGFEDALDHLPPRGRSRKYIDAYTLGQIEARGRAD